MHFIQLILLPPVFKSSDGPIENANRTNAIEMQQKLMEQALAWPFNIRSGWWAYALGKLSKADDCCSWSNVQCTDGVVTKVHLSKYRMKKFYMHLDMLPPSVQIVHVEASIMKRFAARGLPRDLRFILLKHTRVYNGPPPSEIPFHASQELHTADLPQHLEGAFIDIATPLFSAVVIASVPPRLRLLHVSNLDCIRMVLLDNASLPESLEKISVYIQGGKRWPSVHCPFGRKADKRINVTNSHNSGQTSASEILAHMKTVNV